MKRTHLPLNGLRVYDAAARHLSFTRAADELAVTPAAVGQQIRALEDMLGVVLFRRTAKGLALTPEGEAGLDALRRGFLEIEESVRAMQAGQSSKTLTIAAPRDFTAKWLSARLADYASVNPDTRFLLMASDAPPDFTEANLDIAICYGADSGGHEGVAIAPGAMVAITGPAGADAPVIAWPGCPGDDEAAVRLADAGLAIDAVASGLGRATVPALLAAADLAAGRVTAPAGETPSRSTFWLVAPLPQWRQDKVRRLVSALTAG